MTLPPITLTLPSPPVLNSLYRFAGSRMYKVKKAREYEARVDRMLRDMRLRPFPEDHEIAVEGVWYRPRWAGDIDACLKLSLDALQGHAYVNDNQVAVLHLRRTTDSQNPRLELTISSVGLRAKRPYRKATGR